MPILPSSSISLLSKILPTSNIIIHVMLRWNVVYLWAIKVALQNWSFSGFGFRLETLFHSDKYIKTST